MTQITLKDYQQEAVEAAKRELKAGTNTQLIVLPTGTGKTYLMAAIAKEYNKPTLILAHREELINQTVDKFKRYWPEVDIGVCKAERNELDHKIVVGSVQTCSNNKRLKQLKKRGFRVILIDEAHHAPSKSYKKIISKLGFDGKSKLLIGVTATPERNDKLGLLEVFQKIVYSQSISKMINAGHLVPVQGRRILTDTTLVGVSSHDGDFAVGSLAKAVNTPERNAFIASKFVTHAIDRKAIVFCTNVQHTQDLAESFNRHNIKAAAVWGNMPPQDRKQVLSDLQIGTIQVVTSCGVLTEGYDEESIDCIVMARPTKSKGLYIQCVGRGLRKPTDPASSKKDCLVLDFTDNYHNLNAIMTLKATIPGSIDIVDVKEESLVVDEKSTPVVMDVKTKTVEVSDEVFDVLGQTKYLWMPLGDNEFSLMDDDKQEIIIHPVDGGFIAFVCDQNRSMPLIIKPVPLEDCKNVCENFAQEHMPMNFSEIGGSWFQEAKRQLPTHGQIEFLKKNYAFNNKMTKASASSEIRQIIALKNKHTRLNGAEPITAKQKVWLELANVKTDNLSKAEAMRLISNIRQEQQNAKKW